MYQIRPSKSSFTQNLKLSITQTHLDLCRYILHKIKYVAVFGQYGTSSTSNHQLYDVIKLYSLMLKISSGIPKASTDLAYIANYMSFAADSTHSSLKCFCCTRSLLTSYLSHYKSKSFIRYLS